MERAPNQSNSHLRDLERFRGISLSDIASETSVRIGRKLRASLATMETELQQAGNLDGAIYSLGKKHLEGESLRELTRQLGITHPTLLRLFRSISIPIRSHAEATRANWQDPEFRQRNAEGVRANWQDPEFRQRNAEGVRANWQDPEFRQRNAEAIRANWQDPEFRQRHAEATRANWQDPEFRQRNAEGVRQVRLNPANLVRYHLPTISGERWDVGFTQSAWEANLARILHLIGRENLIHEVLRLSNGHFFELDFLTINPRGNLVGYEIMAHPLENPEGWAKLERVITEYPYITFRVIDHRFYRRLERRFTERISLDPRFAGWEERGDNLRTNPQKYA